MSSSNCCFLTCLQTSQEAGQVVWYTHLFKNFPQFIVIHTVKGLGIVNKAEVDAFLEFSCFFDDPTDVVNLNCDSSAFSKSGSSRFTYCWSLAYRILSFTLLACKFAQIHVHWIGDAIQSSHPLSSPPPSFTLSQHQNIFQLIGSLHQVAKALGLQFQHWSFQWIFKADFL